MKQVLQNSKTGGVAVVDVPAPLARPGFVLVRTAASLISAGTERTAIEAAQKGLIGRAVQKPALIEQTIARARTEGIASTISSIQSKLAQSVALGYSAAGAVIEVGHGVENFHAGDRVACAGLGYASHAEVLAVPKNLCVHISENVSFEAAAFATVGAIALQGIRLAELTLGESVVVMGLGLIGQFAVQLVKANGCRVFGIDIEAAKIQLANECGADEGAAPDEAETRVRDWTKGRGADAVLIAAASSSNQPVELAARISRERGRVVVVGDVGLNIPRQAFYERELTLRVSKSYGPGRYDPEYEERGHDYPLGYVRWTEGRNLEAFLDLLADGRVNVARLVTHRFNLVDSPKAYELITAKSESYLGIVLNYDWGRQLEHRISISQKESSPQSAVRLGLIGAGGYAKVLLPLFKSAGADFRSVATASGVTARDVGQQYGFHSCVSNAGQVFDDDETNLIVIATRHDSHADLARHALERGKHVFVEKPLALNDEQLDKVIDAAKLAAAQLMVGFNRRFSPLSIAAKQFFANRNTPLSINYRVNARRAPRGHWTSDADISGGPIVGEVCHFIDLLHFLTGSLTSRVYAEAIGTSSVARNTEDSVVVAVRLTDGSNASITYSTEGDPALAKERIEIFGSGRAFVIDDFLRATAYHDGKPKVIKLRKRDKGQANEIGAVCEMVRAGAPAPIALEDFVTTTRATFRIRESLRIGRPVDLC